MRRLKQRDAAAFQKRGQGKPGGKTAQMGKDCDAPLGLHRRRQSNNLFDEPQAEHHEGRHTDPADEDEEPIKYADVGAGPDQDIGSDHAADRTGSTDQGNLAGRVQPCMGERPNAAAYQVEEQVSASAASKAIPI